MRDIAAVTFDVWETLIHDSSEAEESRVEHRSRGIARALVRHGWLVEAVEVIAAYRAALPEMEAIWSAHRDFDTPEQLGYLLRRLPDLAAGDLGPGALDEASRAYALSGLEIPPVLDPDAADVLAEVAGRGLRVGLVCNTGRTPGWVLRELFRGFGILPHFAALAFSNEERIRKPDPAIFARTLDRLGVEAARAVHVGDDAVADVAGAKAAGMGAILVGTPVVRPPVPPDGRAARLRDVVALLDGHARGAGS